MLNIIVDTQLSVEAGWFAFHQPSICDWVAENQFKVIMTFTLGVYGLAGVLGTKQELDFALRESLAGTIDLKAFFLNSHCHF